MTTPMWMSLRLLGSDLGEQYLQLHRPVNTKAKYKKSKVNVVTLTEWEETIPGSPEEEESTKPIMVKRLR